MLFEVKTRWSQAVQIARTAIHFEGAVARAAKEMVVVCLARELETAGLTRQNDCLNQIFLVQSSELAIDRGLTEPLSHSSGGDQHLAGTQRTTRPSQDFDDCASLSCLTVHETSTPRITA